MSPVVGVSTRCAGWSDYALLRDGWVFKLAMVITATGSIAVWAVLVHQHLLRGRLATLLMTS